MNLALAILGFSFMIFAVMGLHAIYRYDRITKVLKRNERRDREL
jgi:hypothetical protein